MNNELQKALLAILNKTTDAVGKGVDFLSGQIPDVIHQLLMWKAIKSGLIFWLSGLVCGKPWVDVNSNSGLFCGMEPIWERSRYGYRKSN